MPGPWVQHFSRLVQTPRRAENGKADCGRELVKLDENGMADYAAHQTEEQWLEVGVPCIR